MFDLKKDPKDFYRLTISGKIDDASMKRGLDAFLAAVDKDGKSDFLYVITDFEFPTAHALAVEFQYIPRLFASLSKIGKVALIADQSWLRKAAEIESMVIPGLTIETFRPGQEAEAEAWLTGKAEV